MQIELELFDLITTAKIVLTSILLAFLLGPPGIWLARRFGLVDYPGAAAHKLHSRPTPLAGGIILILCLPLVMSIWGMWHEDLWDLFIGAAVIFVFGLLDDYYGFNALQKFSGQIIGAVVLVLNGFSVQFLDGFGLSFGELPVNILQIIITIFWLVGITNAFNLTDSMDGLTAGLVAISAGFFMMTSLVSGQLALAQLSALLFGLAISLYALNMTPALSFLGDSGAQTFGFLLAGIAVKYTPNEAPQGSTWFIPILLLAVPIFDTCLVILSRLRRKKPLFQADVAHTYHRLVKLGLTPRKAVFLIQMVALLSCILAFIMISFSPVLANIIFFALIALGGLAILMLEIYAKTE
jgi:UDP-GlcNAc:undecaprenyl-phosphate/decaprenyl-phosphate GlcNAc-1-phosphate transferase